MEQTVDTPERAKTLTLDPKTGRIFSITAEYGPTPPEPSDMAAPANGPAPAFRRGPRPPMIPGSFQILVIGK